MTQGPKGERAFHGLAEGKDAPVATQRHLAFPASNKLHPAHGLPPTACVINPLNLDGLGKPVIATLTPNLILDPKGISSSTLTVVS